MVMVNVRPFLLSLAVFAASAGAFAQGNGNSGTKQDIVIDVSGPANVSDSDHVNIGTYTKRGNGTMTLRHNLSADLIDIQSGTLLLSKDNLIGDSTNLRLSSGTFATGGHDETLGSLTLAANSIIDLGSGSSILHFDESASTQWSASTLIIDNWTSGSDHLFVGDAITGLTAGQVGQIRFRGADGGLTGAMILCNGEIVPVPEPATIAFGALLLGTIGYRERKRLVAAWGKLVAA
jgi:hypothetical protein